MRLAVHEHFSRPFQSRYPGKCAQCGRPYGFGDRIMGIVGRHPAAYVHASKRRHAAEPSCAGT